MNRFIVHLVAMLAFAFARVASAQTTTETFESFSANATQITSGGVVFDFVSHNAAVFDIYDSTPNSYGWNGTANDKKFIDNTAAAYTGVLPDFSIKSHDGSRFTVGSFWLYPAKFNLTSLGSGGSVTVTGKLAGSTVFTATANSGFNTSTATANGYSKIDLTTFGGANNASKTIDEIEIASGGNFEYLALDAWTWTKAAGYTISTAVTPSGAGTLTCALTSVAPGGSTTCTATTNAGYELNTISGCNGTTSTTSSFTTGAINANCTVTATFVTALSGSISGTDVSCNGGGNGTATVLASNGVTPYTYSWSPSGGTNATATGLSAGTYTVTVTDARNVSIQKSIAVNQPAVLTLSPSTIPDGVVGAAYSQTFSGGGGSPAYGYSMTGSVPGLSLSGATWSGTPTATGNYSVTATVQDSHSCTASKVYPMTVRATVGGTVTGLASGSFLLLANGSDTVTVSANGAFKFPTAQAQGAAYSVTVGAQPSSPPQQCTVSNGSGTVGSGNVTSVAVDCKRLYTVSTAVDPASSGTLSCASTQVAAGSTTSCTATPASGYVLDKISGCGGADSQTSPFTAGPVAGDCTVTAKFATTLAASITETSQPSCNGGANGSLTVTPTGGFSPYTYAWSPSGLIGGSSPNVTGLSAGNYSVTVKDARNNQTTVNAALTDPPALVFGSVTPPDGVNGVAYASTLFTATGGTPPLTFSVTNGAVPGGLTLASDGTLSGTPTTSGTFAFKVGAQDANGCGPYSGAQNTVHIRSTIGGTVSGLASGASVTLANGADTTTVNADGPFAFPTLVDSGSAYSVAVQSVSATPPQFCDVTNGAGTVGTGNVGDVAVNCATSLALGVNDDTDYATYGESLDYLVGVHNPTNVEASGVQIAVTLSSAFDATTTTWQCLGDGSDGVVCASGGSGAALTGTATVPAGATALWALHAKIDPSTTQGTAAVDVTATYAAPWSDTDTLVIFRDGFDAAAAAGEVLTPSRAAAVVTGSDTATFVPGAASSHLIDTLLTLPSSSGIVRVQRLNTAKAPWLRMQWLDAGRERASAWQRANGDAPLAVGAAGRVILLEGRGVSAQLPLDPARR